MPSLLRHPGCPGARPCPGRSSLDRACAPGVTWQLSRSEDRNDQLNHSVHALRGTPRGSTVGYAVVGDCSDDHDRVREFWKPRRFAAWRVDVTGPVKSSATSLEQVRS
jgi:hypothetical protein